VFVGTKPYDRAIGTGLLGECDETV
jgi:hypothetical protein